MKKIVIGLIISLSIISGKAQDAAAIVPLLTIENTLTENLTALQTTMMTTDKIFKDMMEKGSWLKDLKSVRSMIGLIDNVVCSTQNLDIKLAGADNTCFYSFQYQVQIAKFEGAIDLLALVMANGVSMSQGERGNIFSRALTQFEEAQMALAKINKELYSLLRVKESERTMRNSATQIANNRIKYNWD